MVRNSLSCWEVSHLTLLGKTTVLKSLIASQLVYILLPLPTNYRAIEEKISMFFNFLWLFLPKHKLELMFLKLNWTLYLHSQWMYFSCNLFPALCTVNTYMNPPLLLPVNEKISLHVCCWQQPFSPTLKWYLGCLSLGEKQWAHPLILATISPGACHRYTPPCLCALWHPSHGLTCHSLTLAPSTGLTHDRQLLGPLDNTYLP